MASSVHQRRNNPRESPAPQLSTSPTPIATVRRRKWGTSPFDENWLNVDCCGLFCAFFTYCLHLYGCYAVCFILIPPWMSYVAADGVRNLTLAGHFHRFAFCSVAAIAIASHFKAMTTDPGAVPPDASPLPEPSTSSDALEEGQRQTNNDTTAGNNNNDSQTEALIIPKHRQPPARGRRLCRRCNSYKPQRAHHCSVCKRCIIKMDHHCPWVNNCVGIGNHKYFLLFIFYTCVSCIYSLSLVTTRFLVCLGSHSEAAAAHGGADETGHGHHHHSRLRNMHCLDEPTHLLNIVGLMVESILFGLFTTCMMCDQWDVVKNGMTHIDRLKGGDLLQNNKDRVAGTTEVFGMGPTMKRAQERFRSDWLSPFANVCFPESVRDDIYGFCRPCTGGGGERTLTRESSLELIKKNGSDIV